MKQILFIAATLVATIVTQSSAGTSSKDGENIETQERVYQLSQELRMIKQDIHLKREVDRRRRQNLQTGEVQKK